MNRLIFIGLIFISINVKTLAQVAFYEEISNGKLHFYAINTSHAPLVLSFRLDSLNIDKSQFLEHPNDTVTVFELTVGANFKKSVFNHLIKASVNFGNPNAKPDGYKYRLPFEKGAQFECIQSFGGKLSHNQPHSKFAIDFRMPEGSAVHAAGYSIVVFTKEDSNEGGRNRELFIDKANKIMIYQEDGTVASYDHLMFEGVEVEVGDKAKAGQLIGYSGNTGFSTTPHLYFVVWVVKESIPIKFKGQKRTLKEGNFIVTKRPGSVLFVFASALFSPLGMTIPLQ